MNQSAANGNALAFTAGQATGAVMQSILQTDSLQQRICSRPNITFGAEARQ